MRAHFEALSITFACAHDSRRACISSSYHRVASRRGSDGVQSHDMRNVPARDARARCVLSHGRTTRPRDDGQRCTPLATTTPMSYPAESASVVPREPRSRPTAAFTNCAPVWTRRRIDGAADAVDASSAARAGISPSLLVCMAFTSRALARGARRRGRLCAHGAERVWARRAHGCLSVSPRARAPSFSLAALVATLTTSLPLSLTLTTRSSRRAQYTAHAARAASTSCASHTCTCSAVSSGVPSNTTAHRVQHMPTPELALARHVIVLECFTVAHLPALNACTAANEQRRQTRPSHPTCGAPRPRLTTTAFAASSLSPGRPDRHTRRGVCRARAVRTPWVYDSGPCAASACVYERARSTRAVIDCRASEYCTRLGARYRRRALCVHVDHARATPPVYACAHASSVLLPSSASYAASMCAIVASRWGSLKPSHTPCTTCATMSTCCRRSASRACGQRHIGTDRVCDTARRQRAVSRLACRVTNSARVRSRRCSARARRRRRRASACAHCASGVKWALMRTVALLQRMTDRGPSTRPPSTRDTTRRPRALRPALSCWSRRARALPSRPACHG